jgi:hypothetical protein
MHGYNFEIIIWLGPVFNPERGKKTDVVMQGIAHATTHGQCVAHPRQSSIGWHTNHYNAATYPIKEVI